MVNKVFEFAKYGDIVSLRSMSVDEILSAFDNPDDIGRTPLMLAAGGPLCHPERNHEFYQLTDPANIAVAEKPYIECIEYFLSLGIDIDKVDVYSESAIFYAVKLSRSTRIVQLLLTHNAETGFLNRDQESLLHLAVSGEKEAAELISCLLQETGLSDLINIPNTFGLTPASVVCAKVSLQNPLESYIKALDVLLENGATLDITAIREDRNSRNLHLETPLHHATLGYVNQTLLQKILRHTHQVNETNIHGDTALHQVVRNANSKNGFNIPAIKMLIGFGADWDAQNNILETPRSMLAGLQKAHSDFPAKLIPQLQDMILSSSSIHLDEGAKITAKQNEQRKQSEIEGILNNVKEYQTLRSLANEKIPSLFSDNLKNTTPPDFAKTYANYANTYASLFSKDATVALPDNQIAQAIKNDIQLFQQYIQISLQCLNKINDQLSGKTDEKKGLLIRADTHQKFNIINMQISDLRQQQIFFQKFIRFYELTRRFAYDGFRLLVLKARLGATALALNTPGNLLISSMTSSSTSTSAQNNLQMTLQDDTETWDMYKQKIDLLRARVLFLMQNIFKPGTQLAVHEKNFQALLEFADLQKLLLINQAAQFRQPEFTQRWLRKIDNALFTIEQMVPPTLRLEYERQGLDNQASGEKVQDTVYLKQEVDKMKKEINWLRERQDLMMVQFRVQNEHNDAMIWIKQEPNRDEYYRMLVTTIENIFTSFKAVSGGFIDPVKGRYETARVVLECFGDFVSVAPLVGVMVDKVLKWTANKALSKLDDARQHNIADQAGRLLTNAEVMACAHQVALRLAVCYEMQLRMLEAPDNGVERNSSTSKIRRGFEWLNTKSARTVKYSPAQRFALFGAIWVMDLLQDLNQFIGQNELADKIVHGLTRKSPSPSVIQLWTSLQDRFKAALLTTAKGNLSIIDLYTRCGLVTVDNLYYAGPGCDTEKFGWRSGTKEDAAALEFTERSIEQQAVRSKGIFGSRKK